MHVSSWVLVFRTYGHNQGRMALERTYRCTHAVSTSYTTVQVGASQTAVADTFKKLADGSDQFPTMPVHVPVA